MQEPAGAKAGVFLPSGGATQIDLARKCLLLIGDIAIRGACSLKADHIGYALRELSQLLIERNLNQDGVLEPNSAHQIHNLNWLHAELDVINSFSQCMETAEHDYCRLI